MANNFWLNDAQWSATESHPPIVHTGPQRHDDRRVISGIFHRLREGCRWRAVVRRNGRIRQSSTGTIDGASAGFGRGISLLSSSAPIH